MTASITRRRKRSSVLRLMPRQIGSWPSATVFCQVWMSLMFCA
jgi:hypothetical protein